METDVRPKGVCDCDRLDKSSRNMLPRKTRENIVA